MKLNELQPNEGSTKKRKRVGRGTSAGQGKTAGRGIKGQGARSGGSTRLYHQGGNLPFFRRLPFKRGFSPLKSVTYNEVNLDQLAGFKAKSEVSPDSLDVARLLRDPRNPVIILGRGDVAVALKVRAHRVTSGARAKIEAAGGTVEILQMPGSEIVAGGTVEITKLARSETAGGKAEILQAAGVDATVGAVEIAQPAEPEPTEKPAEESTGKKPGKKPGKTAKVQEG